MIGTAHFSVQPAQRGYLMKVIVLGATSGDIVEVTKVQVGNTLVFLSKWPIEIGIHCPGKGNANTVIFKPPLVISQNEAINIDVEINATKKRKFWVSLELEERIMAHCKRDHSLTGTCGGDDQSCSCECTTCRCPNCSKLYPECKCVRH